MIDSPMTRRHALWVSAMLVVTVAVPVSPGHTKASDRSSENCRPPTDTSLSEFQIAELEPSIRCQLGRVINGHTTRGTMGPLETPVAMELYEYLLDRPVITAALVERLGIGAYRFVPQGPRRFWVEDGDGTEGFITLVQQQGGHRIYFIEGNHHGHIWPSVHATAVVLMKLQPTLDRPASVSTSLVSFARLDDKLLRGLVWLLRPLLEDAITRKLTRGFEATYLLGQRIAEEPIRIQEEAATLPFQDTEEAHRFMSLLPRASHTPESAEPVTAP